MTGQVFQIVRIRLPPLTYDRLGGPIFTLHGNQREQLRDQLCVRCVIHGCTKPWVRAQVHNHHLHWRERVLTLKRTPMTAVGTRIEEAGTLIQETDSVVFRRDLGGRWRLDLHRVGMALAEQHAGQRVSITGTVVAKGLIDIDTLAPEA